MTSRIKSQHKTLSSVAVQKILQDIDTIIAERKQELSNIRQRSNNNSTSNSFYLHEKDFAGDNDKSGNGRNKNSSTIVENNVDSFNENIDRTPTNVINNDVASYSNGSNLITPYNLEYSVSQPHSAGSIEQDGVEENNNPLDSEDLFPELDGAQKELARVQQSLNFEANDIHDSSGVSLAQSKHVDDKVRVKVTDDVSVNSSFLAESIASDEQQCVRVSPEELHQPTRSLHQTRKEESMSETFSFGEFEELEELLDDNDQSGFSHPLDDGSLSSCNLNYHAIYGHSESGMDLNSANNSRNAGSSRNNSISAMSSSMGTVGHRNGAIQKTLFSNSQVNPQHQLAMKKKQQQQQQQQQLQLTQQKNELLEKKLHDIEKLIDSDFSEHSLQTKMLNHERAKLWSLKVALEEELEEKCEELLLVRSQLQSKSIRANEFEVRLQELQARLDAQTQEKQRMSNHLLLAEKEAAVEKDRANNLAAELTQVQDSILELSAQLQVRQQAAVFEEQQLQEKKSALTEHVVVAELEPLSVEVRALPPVEQPPPQYTPSELAELEEQLHKALTENDLLAKCLEEILWERNELVDRLEQAKVAVQERDDAVEEMRLLLLSTQEQLKRNPNLTRAPIAERTWVANEPMIPRIKKSFVSRLITLALCLMGIWMALLVGLIVYSSATQPGRSSCPVGSSQCPFSIQNFVTS